MSIPNIELSNIEYKNLIRASFTTGRESFITRVGDNIVKIFRPGFGINLNEEQSKCVAGNKLEKISFLYNLDFFENEVKPMEIYSNQDTFVGYKMTSNMNLINMENYIMERDKYNINYLYDSFKFKTEQLEKAKEKVDYFKSLGIYYGDMSPQNILINRETSKVSFCDLDSIAVYREDEKKIPMLLIPRAVKDFINGYGSFDENGLVYLHNLLSVSILYGKGVSVNKLESVMDKMIADRRVKEPVKTLIKENRHVTTMFSGKHLIDYIRKEA